jgi:hypothetical protein
MLIISYFTNHLLSGIVRESASPLYADLKTIQLKLERRLVGAAFNRAPKRPRFPKTCFVLSPLVGRQPYCGSSCAIFANAVKGNVREKKDRALVSRKIGAFRHQETFEWGLVAGPSRSCAKFPNVSNYTAPFGKERTQTGGWDPSSRLGARLL